MNEEKSLYAPSIKTLPNKTIKKLLICILATRKKNSTIQTYYIIISKLL